MKNRKNSLLQRYLINGIVFIINSQAYSQRMIHITISFYWFFVFISYKYVRQLQNIDAYDSLPIQLLINYSKRNSTYSYNIHYHYILQRIYWNFIFRNITFVWNFFEMSCAQNGISLVLIQNFTQSVSFSMTLVIYIESTTLLFLFSSILFQYKYFLISILSFLFSHFHSFIFILPF